jgi:hypothetical protein
MRYQLNFSWQQILQSAGPTLAHTYTNLTGNSNAFQPFATLLQQHFPQGTPSGLVNDNPFPLQAGGPPPKPAKGKCYLASEVFSYFNKPEAEELQFLLTNFMEGYMQETEERRLVVRLYEQIVPDLRKKLGNDPRRHEIFEIAERLVTKGYESAKAGDYEKTYQLYIKALIYSLVYYLCPQYLKIKDSKVELEISKLEIDLHLLK